MKRLFLASQFYVVGHHIGQKISEATKLKTVFITTPIKYKKFKESELDWHYKNRATLKESGFVCKDYDITGKSESDLQQDLSGSEVMYVEGGNPFYLMQEAQKNNFTKYVADRVSKGMVYVAESAGSLAAGIDIDANSRPGKSSKDYDLVDTKGFRLVNFAILPHWGAESKKSDHLDYKLPQSYNENFPCVLLSNNQYVEVSDDWYKIVDVSK